MSNDLNLRIRIVADGSELKAAVVGAKGELLQLDRSGQTAGQGLQRSFTRARGSVESISDQLSRAKTQLLAFLSVRFAGGLLRDLVNTADQVKLLDARLRLATKTTEEYTNAQRGLFDIAQQTRTGLADNITLYARTAASLKQLGATQQETLDLTEAVGISMQLSGASTQEASGSIRQLSQALASGVLRGDEFNTIMESSIRTQQALADGLNVPIGQLRAMAEAGELTSEKVFRALLSQLPKMKSEFEQIPITVAGAMTQIHNQFLIYVGDVDSARGATAGLVNVLGFVASNFQLVANTAITAVTLLAAAYLGRGVGAVQTFVAELATKVAAHRAEVAASTAAMQAGQIAAAAALKQAQAHVVVTQAALAEAQAHRANVVQLAIYGPVRAAAERQVAAAAAAHVQAAASATAAQASLAATGGRVVGTMGLLRGGLAVLGGPLGAITTALTLGAAAWFTWGNRAADAVETARDRLARLRKEEQQLKAANGQADLDQLNRVTADIADLYRKRESPAAGDEYKAQLNDQLKVLQETQRILGERIQRNAPAGTGPIAQLDKDAQKAKESLDDLIVKMRDQAATTGLTDAQTMRYRVTQGDLVDVIKQAGVNEDEYREKLIAAASGLQSVTQSHEEAVAARRALNEESIQAEKHMDDLPAEYEASIKSVTEYVDELEFEAKIAGLGNEERARAIALRELETKGIREGTEAYAEYSAKIEAAIKSKSASEAAAAIVEDQQREWEKTVDNIDRTFHDGFVRMLEDGKGNWRSFTDSLKNTFKSTVADYIYKALAQPFVLRIAASFAGMVGLPAPAGAAVSTGAALANTGGAGGGGFPSVPGTSSFAHLGGGYGGAFLGVAGGALYGYQQGGTRGAVIGGVAGYAGGAALTAGSAALAAGWGAGASGGAALAGASSALAAIPVWGWAALAALAVFGSGKAKPSNKSAWGAINLDTGATSNFGNMTGKKFSQETVDARDSFFEALGSLSSAITQITGGTLSGSTSADIGQRDGTQVSGIGAGRYANPEAALQGIFSGMLNNLQGVDAQFNNVFARLDLTDLEAAVSDLGVAAAIINKDYVKSEAANQAAQAIKTLNDQFQPLIDNAKRLGLSVAPITAELNKQLGQLTSDFNGQIGDAVLGITNPLALALKQQEAVAKERLDNAKTLGANLVEVERLNALERQSIVEQSVGSISDLITQITRQGLSPQQQIESLRADLASSASNNDIAKLSQIANELANVGKDAYASGPAYQDLIAEIGTTLLAVQDRLAVQGSHATGLPFVPYDGYTATLHGGEAVIDARTMQALRRYGVGGDGSSSREVVRLLEQLVAATERGGDLQLQVVTSDGRVLKEETIREILNRSKKGEVVVDARGVSA